MSDHSLIDRHTHTEAEWGRDRLNGFSLPYEKKMKNVDSAVAVFLGWSKPWWVET